MVIVLQAKVPVEQQPVTGPPAPVGRANTVGGIFALFTLALGLVIIWSQLRARGRKLARHRHRRRHSRHHSVQYWRSFESLRSIGWRRSEAEEQESEHNLA